MYHAIARSAGCDVPAHDARTVKPSGSVTSEFAFMLIVGNSMAANETAFQAKEAA